MNCKKCDQKLYQPLFGNAECVNVDCPESKEYRAKLPNNTANDFKYKVIDWSNGHWVWCR